MPASSISTRTSTSGSSISAKSLRIPRRSRSASNCSPRRDAATAPAPARARRSSGVGTRCGSFLSATGRTGTSSFSRSADEILERVVAAARVDEIRREHRVHRHAARARRPARRRARRAVFASCAIFGIVSSARTAAIGAGTPEIVGTYQASSPAARPETERASDAVRRRRRRAPRRSGRGAELRRDAGRHPRRRPAWSRPVARRRAPGRVRATAARAAPPVRRPGARFPSAGGSRGMRLRNSSSRNSSSTPARS